MSVFHRVALSESYVANNLRYNKNLSYALALREQKYNAYLHGAKKALLVSGYLTFNKKERPYSIFLHNGVPFKNEESIRNAFCYSVSGDDMGGQGSGGCTASLLTVTKTSDAYYIIYSKTEDGPIMLAATYADNEVKTENLGQAGITQLKKIIGKQFDDYNVAYCLAIRNADKNGNDQPLQDSHVLRLLTDITPKMPEFIFAYKGHIANESLDTKTSPATPLISQGECDKLLAEERVYEFKLTADVKVECGGEPARIPTNVRVKVTLFSGLFQNINGKADFNNNNGYCDLKTGIPQRYLKPPKFDTFLHWATRSGRKTISDRLADDPIFAAHHINAAARILGVGFASDRTFMDVEDFGEYDNVVKNSKHPVVRRPYMRLDIIIDSFGQGKKIRNEAEPVRLSDQDMMNEIGGVSSVFYCLDDNKTTKVVDCILSSLADDPGCKEELKLLRERAKQLWPIKIGDLTPYRESRKAKCHFLKFYAKNSADLLSTVNCGELVFGHLRDADDMPIDPSMQLFCVDDCNVIKHYKDDIWSLEISDLRLRDGTKLTREEFLKFSAKETLPKRDICLRCDTMIYKLNTRVLIPVRAIAPRTPSGIIREEELITKSDLPYKDMTPPEAYAEVDLQGKVWLNQSNQTIRTLLTRGFPDKYLIQNKIIERIIDSCKAYWAIIKRGDIRFANSDDEEIWGGKSEANRMFLNKFLDLFFKEKAMLDKIKEMEEARKKLGSQD